MYSIARDIILYNMADDSSEGDVTSVIDLTIDDCEEQHCSRVTASQTSFVEKDRCANASSSCKRIKRKDTSKRK